MILFLVRKPYLTPDFSILSLYLVNSLVKRKTFQKGIFNSLRKIFKYQERRHFTPEENDCVFFFIKYIDMFNTLMSLKHFKKKKIQRPIFKTLQFFTTFSLFLFFFSSSVSFPKKSKSTGRPLFCFVFIKYVDS